MERPAHAPTVDRIYKTFDWCQYLAHAAGATRPAPQPTECLVINGLVICIRCLDKARASICPPMLFVPAVAPA